MSLTENVLHQLLIMVNFEEMNKANKKRVRRLLAAFDHALLYIGRSASLVDYAELLQACEGQRPLHLVLEATTYELEDFASRLENVSANTDYDRNLNELADILGGIGLRFRRTVGEWTRFFRDGAFEFVTDIGVGVRTTNGSRDGDIEPELSRERTNEHESVVCGDTQDAAEWAHEEVMGWDALVGGARRLLELAKSPRAPWTGEERVRSIDEFIGDRVRTVPENVPPARPSSPDPQASCEVRFLEDATPGAGRPSILRRRITLGAHEGNMGTSSGLRGGEQCVLRQGTQSQEVASGGSGHDIPFNREFGELDVDAGSLLDDDESAEAGHSAGAVPRFGDDDGTGACPFCGMVLWYHVYSQDKLCSRVCRLCESRGIYVTADVVGEGLQDLVSRVPEPRYRDFRRREGPIPSTAPLSSPCGSNDLHGGSQRKFRAVRFEHDFRDRPNTPLGVLESGGFGSLASSQTRNGSP
jgi:hypothetical protein